LKKKGFIQKIASATAAAKNYRQRGRVKRRFNLRWHHDHEF